MRDDFPNRRDYDVLVQSPELFERSNSQGGALKRQLKQMFPTAKNSGLSYEDRELNARLTGLLSPERIDGVIEEVHHKNALSLLGQALDMSDDAGKRQIYNLLEQNGVHTGNNVFNLINLNIDDHDELHNFAREMGLEMQGKGTKGLARRLMDSKTDSERLDCIQDYIDYGIPLLEEKADELITSREKRKKARGLAYQYKKAKR